MAKKGKAARRNEVDEPEDRSLSNVPRAEKTDLTSAIIRATIKKNEDLLSNKMAKTKESKNKITKKENKLVTNMNKIKLEKALALTDRLEGKISKSKQRSRMVQTVRKSNWDMVNAEAKSELEQTLLNVTAAELPTNSSNEKDSSTNEDSTEKMEEDDFYSDKEEEKEQNPTVSKSKVNAFALLDEIEA
ncbi:hypothetical protein WICPIJ_003860 [Wickerhamomyces pijperi]|uniref:Uncharacterized protein n=1 Tax=Wickerhamomyces pijperi TaxID=599730 RepID=A0A9P8Q8V6_WICPI|nr:hypothetical protein WICPIJ_003860 [Wickerhamomyces pijperi]